MSAACDGAVDEYQGFAGQVGWFPVCGTSEATPLFAGVVALADQVAGHPLGLINPALYAMARAGDPGIADVTSGNNTVTFRLGGTLTPFPVSPLAEVTTSPRASERSMPPSSFRNWPRPHRPNQVDRRPGLPGDDGQQDGVVSISATRSIAALVRQEGVSRHGHAREHLCFHRHLSERGGGTGRLRPR